MEKKKTTELIDQLRSYFGATVIGSYLFVDSGLLSEEDINDIDIVPRAGRLGDTGRFLEDNNFISSDKIRYTSAEYDKPIDVLTTLVGQPTNVDDLVKFKFNRGYLDDLRQLKKVVENKINKNGNTE